ncbi:hydroquinone glucosyltransferase-like [Dioscorea cayenensis subsp. rotundata]|uniref:Glycosyltransferase n=1 Tax=Dioscorea cayennensis subsp. rotundata TaxID=55577 RepID=A0AB40BAL8_DIOCR|nr:hydroquinone glucosyltransferase-like [Dioscorea cayenensis subsp. rotundata]
MEEDRRSHAIALLSSPGVGHLIPLAELARRLARDHHFTVTLITQSAGPISEVEQNLTDSIPKDINVVSLSPPSPSSIPDGLELGPLIFLTINHNIPRVRAILQSLATSSVSPLAALVVDLFCVGAFSIAQEIGVPPYMLYTSPCMMLSFCLYLPTIDAMYQVEYKDLTEPLCLPGCVPLHGRDFPDPLHHGRNSEPYKGVLWLVNQFPRAKGILVNTFQELEPGVIKALKDDATVPAIYPVGPLIRSCTPGPTNGGDCLAWLDKQNRGSVLFVSFGSGGTLSAKQLNEVACGLEMSGHPFLWVVKSPNDHDAAGTFFSVQSKTEPLAFLPQGFLERTKDSGLTVPSWAPQIEILSHESTGGFLTHCGWNSALESMVNGVPLIVWPLYAEQRTNTVLLVDDVKVALRPIADENGFVTREEVSRVIKCLMEGVEGKRLRAKMATVSNQSSHATSTTGSSSESLCEIVLEWKNNK